MIEEKLSIDNVGLKSALLNSLIRNIKPNKSLFTTKELENNGFIKVNSPTPQIGEQFYCCKRYKLKSTEENKNTIIDEIKQIGLSHLRDVYVVYGFDGKYFATFCDGFKIKN